MSVAGSDITDDQEESGIPKITMGFRRLIEGMRLPSFKGTKIVKKKDQAWAQDPKEEVEESWESEADPNRREWDLRYGFFKPNPDRYGLVCWTCKYRGAHVSGLSDQVERGPQVPGTQLYDQWRIQAQSLVVHDSKRP